MTAEHVAAHNVTESDAGRVRVLAFAALILVGLGLRLFDSYESSFWLDELHSFSHGRRPTPADTADAVQRDFHAPLFFLCVEKLREHLPAGVHPHVLRGVNFAAGFLTILPVALLAGRIGGRRTAWTAAAFAACLPFQIHFGTEFRPYSLLMLCAATAGYAAFDDRGPAWLRWILFFCATAVGVLTQFLMGLIILGIGFGRIVAFVVQRAQRRRDTEDGWRPLPLWTLVTTGALGGAALLPWLIHRMPWLFESGGTELVAPDGPTAHAVASVLSRKALFEVAQQPLRLFAPSIGSLGADWARLASLGFTMVGVASALGLCVALFRGKRPSPTIAVASAGEAAIDVIPPTRANAALPIAAGLSAAFVFTLLVLAWAQIFFWKRFVLRYDVLEAWIVPIAPAVILGGLAGRLGSILRGVLLTGVVLMGTAQAFGDDFEPIDTAMTAAREAGALLTLEDPTNPPLYTGLLWQPRYFSSLLAFHAYGSDLPFCAPELLPRPGEPGFERPVVVAAQLHRDLAKPGAWSDDDPYVGGIRRGRKLVRHVPLNDRVSVWVFAPAAKPESR